MSILRLPNAHPEVILFDWHATLVDTHDAMYHAVEDVIPELTELNLIDRLVKPEDSRNLEDAKLVKYVRENARLHPRIKTDRKISRTDIFEVLFGDDDDAKKIAHQAFDRYYGDYVGDIHPIEPMIGDMLRQLRAMGLQLGVLSNRKREFMEHEVALVDDGQWRKLIDTMVCGDDTAHRKPAPDPILKALNNLNAKADQTCWYVGDSTTDIYAAKEAGVSAIFYNGASWNDNWINKIFPGTVRHPHKPDAVIHNFHKLLELACRFLRATEH